MDVHLDRRAEIAYRSLAPDDRSRIENIISRLSNADSATWGQAVDAQFLDEFEDERLYSIPAGASLRMLSKLLPGALVVQDIFPKERLERISGKLP